jgi:mRNA interferase MazF
MGKSRLAPASVVRPGSGMRYVPERGHVVWLAFTPQAGHEQAGRRPAVVLSPRAYNAKVGLCLACPVTSQVKGYPFEVAVPPGLPVAGVALADQLKSLDWQAREAAFICTLPAEVTDEILAKAAALLSAD